MSGGASARSPMAEGAARSAHVGARWQHARSGACFAPLPYPQPCGLKQRQPTPGCDRCPTHRRATHIPSPAYRHTTYVVEESVPGLPRTQLRGADGVRARILRVLEALHRRRWIEAEGARGRRQARELGREAALLPHKKTGGRGPGWRGTLRPKYGPRSGPGERSHTRRKLLATRFVG